MNELLNFVMRATGYVFVWGMAIALVMLLLTPVLLGSINMLWAGVDAYGRFLSWRDKRRK
ncbi:hypothetical protein D5039_00010 [Verminephrobacter aporrectodeae subsp. tuberculatae]|uniref:TMhelix containing protein n=2 Tax=Verminephrobacter TaxID=364316 RepID=A0ABT3KMR1_9BURK|nr:hypothetical protein [Verminephrobacter aporrectodeae subsp. tuberculatae]